MEQIYGDHHDNRSLTCFFSGDNCVFRQCWSLLSDYGIVVAVVIEETVLSKPTQFVAHKNCLYTVRRMSRDKMTNRKIASCMEMGEVFFKYRPYLSFESGSCADNSNFN